MSDIIQAIPAKTEGMSTGVKILLTSALILVIAGAVYFGTKPPKNKDNQTGGNSNSNTASDGLTYSPSGSAPAGNSSAGTNTSGFPLNVGSTGPLVKDIQNGLNKSVNAGLAVDGIFGPLTLAAVKKAKFTVPIQQDEYTSIKSGQTGDKILYAFKNIFADGSGVSTYSRSPLTYPPVTGIMKEYGIKLRNDINV